MLRNHLIVLILLQLGLYSCQEKEEKFAISDSDLGHIDFVLDSIAFNAILEDSFLRNEFAVVFQDTTDYSKPSYDIYLLGAEAFLHISLAKDYWENKAGSGVMIFQTRKPVLRDSLLLGWKQFFADSLYTHTFQGGDFELGEIYPYRDKNSPIASLPRFTPILTSYSAQSYQNWGFDSAGIKEGIPMQEFMKSWDLESQSRLFKKLRKLSVQLTELELKEMESALFSMGYSKENTYYFHPSNPTIEYAITTTNQIPKYTRIEIEMNSESPDRVIDLGSTYQISVKGTSLVIEQKKGIGN